ncbi:MAG: Energy-coupling factor transporter transmembraneprotein EcfT [Candidatus Argoarchaeum ethanivorans]|uniref:Energy-coupling factor transporter transmembraneprotein EcfT n=1 Tax=Candidatus Argoarchaeum ethanivorans TaxID=2608793 RepID=A0A811TFH8_9EURY|nr:MAG: Energy-coupling factor transporter transmembraneprotein EcfT [Candidatus Argoarchaeum ethanivorans]
MRLINYVQEVDFERLVVGSSSAIHRLDARVKLIGAFALIFCIISMKHPLIPLFIFCAAALICFGIKMPRRIYLKRLVLLPFSVATVVLVVIIFTYGGEHQVASFFGLPIYHESCSFAVLLFARIIASISVLSVFVATTQVLEATETMQWFKVPKVMVDLAVMMLRYIHLLSVESVKMYRAQASRCGFSQQIGYKQKLKNLSTIAGSLILRALKRGERVYAAMLSRGYTVDSQLTEIEPLSIKNALFCVIIIAVSVLLVIVDRIWLGAWTSL